MDTKNINTYAEESGFGSGTNRTKFNSSGEMSHEGTATQWDDILGAVTGVKLNDTKGTVGFDYNEGSLVFEPGGDITVDNDCVWFNIQKMHAVKTDSELRMHIHYTQTDTTERVFTLKYRVQPNGGTKTTTWTTTTATCNAASHVFPYTSGSINQIVQFPAIDWSAVGISSTVQFRLARTDSLTGNVEATFIDGHVELDSQGSNQEYVK